MNKKLFTTGSSLSVLSIFGALLSLGIMILFPTFGLILLIFNGVMFFAGILFVIISLVQQEPENKEKKRTTSNKSAIEILKKRFANGKISKKEFEAKKKVLMK